MATSKPMIDQIRVMAAKLETTNGTVVSLTSAEGVFNVFNARIEPDDNENVREAQGRQGTITSQPGSPTGRCTFEVEAVGKGSSGQPDWAQVFLPCCNYGQSSGVFTYANGVETCTISLWEDGKRRTLYGCRGTFKLTKRQGSAARFAFEFIGKYVEPADEALLTPTFPTVLAPVDDVTVTLGSYTPILSEFEFDAGNVLVMREDLSASDNTGLRSAAITNSTPMFTMDPEDTVTGTQDWRALQLASTEAVLTAGLGSSANNIITLTSQKAQVTKSPKGNRNGIVTRSITLPLNDYPVITLT